MIRYFVFVVVLAFVCCGRPPGKVSLWSEEQARNYVLMREDPVTWDFDMLAGDLATDSAGSGDEAMRFGVFPVPEYGLQGEDSFRGLGFRNDFRSFGCEGKHLIYSAFFVRRNKFNTSHIPAGKSDEVFFTIAVLSNAPIDTIDYSHCVNRITSRNHPHHAGQGRIRSEQQNIDYTAFLTADRNEYALVAMRLFDLRQGRLILIAPQQDGSLRSMQTDPGFVFTQEEIDAVLDEVLERESVRAFFRASDTIRGITVL